MNESVGEGATLPPARRGGRVPVRGAGVACGSTLSMRTFGHDGAAPSGKGQGAAMDGERRVRVLRHREDR